jgi:cytidyltransferase-like protein
MEKYAPIVTFEELNQVRDKLGKIVCTSGGFDPLHPGHASCIVESKQYGDTLVVVVNGDSFLKNKKGKPFMDLMTRAHLVACLREVDYVIPFEIENDTTVCQALRLIRPDVFTKGGDRVDNTNIPEWQVCQELGIELISQVGRPKLWSSSDFLKDWGEFWLERTIGPEISSKTNSVTASNPKKASRQEGSRVQGGRQKQHPVDRSGLPAEGLRLTRDH